MKNLIKSVYILGLVFLFTACADKNKLITKAWVMDLDAMAKNATMSESERKKLEESTAILKRFLGNRSADFDFKADGSFAGASPGLKKLTKWMIEGNSLLLMTDDAGLVRKVKIIKLTKDQLILDFKDKNGNPTYLKPKKSVPQT